MQQYYGLTKCSKMIMCTTFLDRMYHVDPIVTERNAFRVNASYLLIIVKL